MITGSSLADYFVSQVMVGVVVTSVAAFTAGGLCVWMVLSPAAEPVGLDVDLDPCSPRAATVPGPGWGFATCRPDQVGDVVFSPSGQAVLNCVCGD